MVIISFTSQPNKQHSGKIKQSCLHYDHYLEFIILGTMKTNNEIDDIENSICVLKQNKIKLKTLS